MILDYLAAKYMKIHHCTNYLILIVFDLFYTNLSHIASYRSALRLTYDPTSDHPVKNQFPQMAIGAILKQMQLKKESSCKQKCDASD